MMHKEIIKRTVSELRAEADIDFFDVSFIAEGLREDLDLKSQSEIRECSLEVINRLIDMDVHPGDYMAGAQLAFWQGEAASWIKRIESEWIAMGRTPTLEHPICWFGLNKSCTAHGRDC